MASYVGRRVLVRAEVRHTGVVFKLPEWLVNLMEATLPHSGEKWLNVRVEDDGLLMWLSGDTEPDATFYAKQSRPRTEFYIYIAIATTYNIRVGDYIGEVVLHKGKPAVKLHTYKG